MTQFLIFLLILVLAGQLAPDAYTRAFLFPRRLGKYRWELTTQQLRTLCGQALKGDLDGAVRGLGRMLMQREGVQK